MLICMMNSISIIIGGGLIRTKGKGIWLIQDINTGVPSEHNLMITSFVAHGAKEKTSFPINWLKRTEIYVTRNIVTDKKRSISYLLFFWIITSTPTSLTKDSTRIATHMILKWRKDWKICLPNMLPKARHIVQKWIWKITYFSLLIFTAVVINMSLQMHSFLDVQVIG